MGVLLCEAQRRTKYEERSAKYESKKGEEKSELLCEEAGCRNSSLRAVVFGTDISGAALAQAREGAYSREALENVRIAEINAVSRTEFDEEAGRFLVELVQDP